MTSIDGLFEQIIHYEKTAQERKNLLQDLRQTVLSAQEKGRALEKKYCELKTKLAEKVGELSDKELRGKWLSSQETIYQQQLSELEKQLHGLEEDKKSVIKTLQEEKEKFCANITNFYTNFGPRSSSSPKRERKFAARLQDLQKQKEELKSAQDNYNARDEAVRKLCTEKESLKTQLEKIILENQKLTSSLCEELQRSSDLEDEKLKVTHIPNTDVEFKSIQEELETERQLSVNIEEQFSQVQSQLHKLHQKLWQQQLKHPPQLKQQQQLQKQQTKQQQQQPTKWQQQKQGIHSHSQTRHTQDLTGVDKNAPTRPSVARQQRRNVENERQTSWNFRGKPKVLNHNSNTDSGTSNQMEVAGGVIPCFDGSSQPSSDMGSGIEEYSDILFSDDDTLSSDNQLSQDDKTLKYGKYLKSWDIKISILSRVGRRCK